MPRRIVQTALCLALIGLTGGACAKTSTTTPVTPTANPITEPTFTGTLSLNGAATYPFSTVAAGTVTATIADIAPDPNGNVAIGLSLGTWNGTTCQIVLDTPNALTGSSVVGAVSGAGALCARVYDLGNLTEAVTFSVNIVHF